MIGTNFLRTSFRYLLVLVAARILPASTFAADVWGPPTNGFQLSAASRKTNYQLGEEIDVMIILKNVDNRPHWFLRLPGAPDFYQFAVETSSGKTVPHKAKEKKASGQFEDGSLWNPGLQRTELAPGQERQVVYTLQDQVSLDEPGNYKLRIERLVPILPAATDEKAQKYTNLISNTSHFSISPSSAETLSNAWGKPCNGFQLSVSLEKTNYIANESIFVTLKLKNIDNHEHWAWTGGTGWDYKFIVNTNEKVTPGRPEGRVVGGYHDISDTTVGSFQSIIAPGNQMEERLDLNYQFEPIKPGNYVVTVFRDVPVLPIPTNANAKIQYATIFATPVTFTVSAPNANQESHSDLSHPPPK